MESRPGYDFRYRFPLQGRVDDCHGHAPLRAGAVGFGSLGCPLPSPLRRIRQAARSDPAPAAGPQLGIAGVRSLFRKDTESIGAAASVALHPAGSRPGGTRALQRSGIYDSGSGARTDHGENLGLPLSPGDRRPFGYESNPVYSSSLAPPLHRSDGKRHGAP